MMLAMSGLGVACSNNLPSYDDVLDLRILAMQANPPEILLDLPGSLAVTTKALVVNPRGGSVHYQWSFCPVDSEFGCLDLPTLLVNNQVPAEDQVFLQAMAQVSQSGTCEPQNANGLSYYPIPDFDLVAATQATLGYDATPQLYTYYQKTSLFNQIQGAWVSVVLTVTSDTGDSTIAFKRVVLNVQTPSNFAEPLLGNYGIVVCPPSPNVGLPGCLPLLPRVANQNPVLQNVYLATDTAPLSPSVPFVGIPSLQSGGNVRFLPQFSSDSAQAYQQIQGNAQTHGLQVVDLVEEPSVSFFADAGSFDHALTWPKFTLNLSNVYTAPTLPPGATNQPVHLWLVGRDQRGGETWQSLQLTIAP